MSALPELMDAAQIRDETGMSRAATEGVMRQLPTVQFEGLRKVYVKRSDLAALIDARTFTKDRVPT